MAKSKTKPVTLKISNESKKTIHLIGSDPKDKISITKSNDMEVEEKYLRSREFLTHIEAGDLRFVKSPSTEKAEYDLALRVIEPILHRIGTAYIELYAKAKQAKENMKTLRDRYNNTWKETKDLLKDANAKAKAAEQLHGSIDHFINVKQETKRVEELKKELDDLENPKKLPTNNAAFSKLLKDRDKKRTELQQAQNALAASEQVYAVRYKPLIDGLKKAVDGLDALKPNIDIGSPVDKTW